MYSKTRKIINSILFTILLIISVILINDIAVYPDDGQFPPMIKIQQQERIATGYTLKSVEEKYLVHVGRILETVSGSMDEDYQTNIKQLVGASVYLYTDSEMYKNNILLEGDVLVYYEKEYLIFEIRDGNMAKINRKVQPY